MKKLSVYVAGKEPQRAARMIERVRAAGHTVAFDWIAAGDFDAGLDSARSLELAIAERAAVQRSDAVIYLWEPGQESARYEAGMALGLEIPLIVVGHESFFYYLPGVEMVADEDEALVALECLARAAR